MNVSNPNRGVVLAGDCRVATGFWPRARGLLFSSPLLEGQGLWLDPCQSVHTILMGYPIDVLFLDKENRVAHLIQAMPPYRASRFVWRARSVLELPAGTVARTRTAVGDQLLLRT